MQRSFGDSVPRIADDAFVSEMAYAIGDVEVGPRASIWPFVCLRGDGGTVSIGAETNVQEFTMVHGASIGDEVTVGHGAVVDYATVHDHSLIGMGSAVMGGATVESNCIVAANAVVRQGQRVPEGHMAYGIPAETRPLDDEQLTQIGATHENYVELAARYRGTAAERGNDDGSPQK